MHIPKKHFPASLGFGEINFGNFGPIHFTVSARTFLAVLILKAFEESAERLLSGRSSRTRT